MITKSFILPKYFITITAGPLNIQAVTWLDIKYSINKNIINRKFNQYNQIL